MEQMTQLTSMCEMACQIIQKKQEEKRIEEEQAAKAQNSKIPVCYDDDDDYNSAITPNEPVDSLSMGDEHLNTISATKSDEFIKSCVENLVPSESEGENGCDVLAWFTTFSNILFEANYKSDSSDYQSCYNEDFSEEIFSNPLFEEEINSMRIDQHHLNAESDLIESLLNRDSSIISSSSKTDSLLYEFAEEFVSENSDADIESFSPSPIPNEDSDSFMEEIDLSFNPDDPMPPGIEEDDDDSERDMLIHEELLDNYSLSLPVIESFYFDIPLFSRPLAKPPDDKKGRITSSICSLDKSSSSINDLYKGLNVITKLLKDINNDVKDDPATNKKIDEAIKTFAKISAQTTEILSLEASAAWTKSSTNLAWNLGSRMTAVEISQTALKREVSSLRQDTSEIIYMMAKIYQAFKGQPYSAPTGSVTLTLALTHILANVEGDNATNTATEEPPSHTEGETGDTTMAIPISSIYPTKEKMKKAEEETKLLAMSRPEVMKVVREEAKKLGIDPKELISTKAGETFKKA
nr:hypothetical protein [Tanacetum cinerariifolium]